jgi:hypothetical protein
MLEQQPIYSAVPLPPPPLPPAPCPLPAARCPASEYPPRRRRRRCAGRAVGCGLCFGDPQNQKGVPWQPIPMAAFPSSVQDVRP